MNLDNVKYASMLIKIKDGKAFEIELRNCESVPDGLLQKIIPALQRELRVKKYAAMAARDKELKAKEAANNDEDAAAAGL